MRSDRWRGRTHVLVDLGGAPLTTTTTTEPQSESSSTTSGATKDPPSGSSILSSARRYMAATDNVTLSGSFYDPDRDLTVTVTAEGSTGGLLSTSKKAGISRTTRSVPGGGRMEVVVVGTDHYLKVNKAWLEVMEVPRDSPMRKNTGRWVKFPFENSPLDVWRPQTMLQQIFYGTALTPFDAKKSPAVHDELQGTEVYRVAIRKAKASSSGGERTLLVSTDPSRPAPIRLVYGQGERSTRLGFSRWGSSREDFSRPASAKVIENLSADDF